MNDDERIAVKKAYENKAYKECLELLNPIIKKNPNDAEALYERCFAYIKLERLREAGQDFAQAYQLDSKLFEKLFANMGEKEVSSIQKLFANIGEKKVSEVKTFSAEIQEGIFQGIFKELEKKYKKEEGIWLVMSMVSVFIFIFFLFFDVTDVSFDTLKMLLNKELIPSILFKITLISSGVFVIICILLLIIHYKKNPQLFKKDIKESLSGDTPVIFIIRKLAFIFLIILIGVLASLLLIFSMALLVDLDGHITQSEVPFYFKYIFSSAIVFLIIRQYIRVKTLRIEAVNRVAMANMFHQFSGNEKHDIFLPKIVDAIVYSTRKTKKNRDVSINIEKLMDMITQAKS